MSEEIRADGGTAVPIVMNLRDPEGIADAVARAVAELGRLDILVNNAAIFVPGTIESARERHIELSLDVNLRGPMLAMRAAFPHLKAVGGGHIINVSSRGAIPPGPGPYSEAQRGAIGDLLYGPEKSAIEHFSQRQAMAYQDDGIAINVLSPAKRVRTPGNLFAANDPEHPDLSFEAADAMGKAAVWICGQTAHAFTGNIVYDDELCAEHRL